MARAALAGPARGHWLELTPLASPRCSFDIAAGATSWLAHSPRGHRPVPECQAPAGRSGALSGHGPSSRPWVRVILAWADTSDGEIKGTLERGPWC